MRDFEDGEHKGRPLVDVRGEDVFIVQSLYGDELLSVNDKICRFLFLAGAMRDCGAKRVVALIPYLAYARKDRRTKPNDPLTARYLAQAIEAMGVDLVVVLEVHNPAAFENAFRIPTICLDPHEAFAYHIKERVADRQVVVLSPDPGGVKRAQLFREALERVLRKPVDLAYVEKRRSAGVVSGDLLVGEVGGATVLIIDDLISTGGTMMRAAEKCRAQGAREIFALAAHGLFVGNASEVLASKAFSKVLVTDSVPPFRVAPTVALEHLEVVSAAPIFADVIRRCLSPHR
jgi:ribose-phosphate pyrophosphokinase